MTRPPVLRAIAALIILGLSAFFAVTKPAQLGLDLRGGTSITLETRDSPTTKADAEATDRALEVLRRRVDAIGVAEPTLARSGSNRIIVELPGVQNAADAAAQLGQTAQLTFHPVLAAVAPPVPTATAVPSVAPASPAPASPAPAPTVSTQGRAAVGLPDAQAPEPPPAPTAPAPEPSVPLAPSEEPVPTLLPAAPAPPPDAAEFDASKEQTILDEDGRPIVIGPAALTGEGVGDASSQVDPQTGTGRFVSIDFRGDGGRKWEELTAAAACAPPGDPKRRVAIVLDGRAISSPQVATGVACNVGIQGGQTSITGSFTQQEAQELAVLIKGGALPVPVEIISRSTVGPTLGQEAIDATIRAAVIGFILTALFFTVVYRLVGFLAVLALTSFGVIAYGTLVGLGATITLPGLAGLLLSAGLAIDANILVFERAREEYARSRSRRLLPALDVGFTKALSAITDSNATTVLAAALLFLFATGPVRGFAVTLTVGTIASLVSALLVTRVLTDFAVQRGWVERHTRASGISSIGRFRGFLERSGPDLMSRYKLWFTITSVALLLAVAGMFLRGFNFGVEFTGGRLIEYTPSQTVAVADARNAVTSAGFATAVVQESGEGTPRNISVRTGKATDEQEARIRTALERVTGPVEVASDSIVGPTLGNELRRKAIIALVLALIAQLGYLAIRFRWTFAAGAVTAIFHDVLLVLGIFAWLGKPIDGLFLASALTIIGVSVNDTIITLDRVRETWALNRTKPLRGLVNTAILQTAPRTINTTVGAMFILGALLLLGGASLSDFALALVVGLLVGTYSSAFFVCPLMIELEKRNNAPPPMPKRRSTNSAPRRRPANKRPQPVKARVRPQGGTV